MYYKIIHLTYIYSCFFLLPKSHPFRETPQRKWPGSILNHRPQPRRTSQPPEQGFMFNILEILPRLETHDNFSRHSYLRSHCRNHTTKCCWYSCRCCSDTGCEDRCSLNKGAGWGWNRRYSQHWPQHFPFSVSISLPPIPLCYRWDGVGKEGQESARA